MSSDEESNEGQYNVVNTNSLALDESKQGSANNESVIRNNNKRKVLIKTNKRKSLHTMPVKVAPEAKKSKFATNTVHTNKVIKTLKPVKYKLVNGSVKPNEAKKVINNGMIRESDIQTRNVGSMDARTVSVKNHKMNASDLKLKLKSISHNDFTTDEIFGDVDIESDNCCMELEEENRETTGVKKVPKQVKRRYVRKNNDKKILSVKKNIKNAKQITQTGGDEIDTCEDTEMQETNKIEICDNVFLLNNGLLQGLKMEGQFLGIQPSVKFKCYKCGENNFRTITSLQDHICKCDGQISAAAAANIQRRNASREKNQTNLRITRRVYLCSSCMTYYQNWDLYVHMRDCHSKQICLYCLMLFTNSNDLYNHLSKFHKIVINKFTTEEEIINEFNETYFLTCCKCNHLFTEEDNFLDHKCEDFIAQQKNTDAPPPPKTIIFPATAKFQNISHSKNIIIKPIQRSHKSKSSILEEDDYDVSDAASFCHVALDDGAIHSRAVSATDSDKDFNFKINDEIIVKKINPPKIINSMPLKKQKIKGNLNASQQNKVKSKENFKSQEKNVSPNNSNIMATINEVSSLINTAPHTNKDSALDKQDNVFCDDNTVLKIEGAQNEMLQNRSGDNCKSDEFTDNSLNSSLVSYNAANNCKKYDPKEISVSEQITTPMDRILERDTSDNIDNDKMDIDKLSPKIEDAYDMKVNNELEKNDISEMSELKENIESQQNVEEEPNLEKMSEDEKDVLVMALMLDENVETLPVQTVIKECIRTSCASCLYCSNATNIAVNGEQLALHLLEKHRYMPTKNGTWQDVVTRLQNGLEDLRGMYLNTDTFDSAGEGNCHIPFNQIFACFQCHYIGQLHKELYLHKRKVHQKNIFFCTMCKCNFSSYSELFCHLCPGVCSSTLSKLQFRCCICGIGNIPSAFRLMVHLRKVHHTCDICLEKSSDHLKLQSHLGKHKVHHLCYKCGISYRSKADINKHLFWKHGTESVMCKKCLQKKWSFIYHFCSPLATHTCEECNDVFSRAVALTVHKRLHLNVYPFPCDQCDQKFISKKLFNKHKDKSHNDKKYVDSVSGSGENNFYEDKCLPGEVDLKLNDAKLDDSDRKKLKKKSAKGSIIDVYDLPPLNLSSDSEDSEDDSNIKSTNDDKNQSHVQNDIGTQNVIEKIETNNADENIDTNNPKVDIGTKNVNDVTSGSGDVNDNNELKDDLSLTAPCTDDIWGHLNICKIPSNSESLKVEKPIDLYLRYIIWEHDYCVPQTIPEDKKDGTLTNNDQTVLTNDKLTDVSNASCQSQVQSQSSIISDCSLTPCKQKHRIKKRNSKSNRTESSSSSSSSSDSESSSSCGSNCSCSHSSSSSSSSSDSECSSPEKRKSHRERKLKKTYRLKDKEKSGTHSQDKNDNGILPLLSLSIRESDLDTDISSSDEDFYEKQPYVWRPENHQPAHADAEIETDSLENQGSKATAKKKVKIKKSKKSKKNPTKESIVNRDLESSFYSDQPMSPFVKQYPTFSYHNDRDLYNALSSDCSDARELLNHSISSVNHDSSTVPTDDETRYDSSRQSKRKRVKNRFYGYSSNSDEEMCENDRFKSKKLSIKLMHSEQINQRKSFTTSLQQKKLASPAQHGFISPQPGVTPSSVRRKTPSPLYPKICPPRQGIRIIPPVKPPPSASKPSYQIISAKTNNLSDSEPEKKVNPLYINVSRGGVSNIPSTNITTDRSANYQIAGGNRNSATMPSGTKSDNLYCYCQCPYDEVSEMIACDNPSCKIEWYHFECVGIMVPPKGKWYCPSCRKVNKSSRSL